MQKINKQDMIERRIFRDNYVPTWQILPITINHISEQRELVRQDISLNTWFSLIFQVENEIRIRWHISS